MTFGKRIEITKRGYKLLEKYTPGLIRAKVFSASAEALSPFVNIWFSARIINEITAERRVNRLVLYVLLTIGLNFAFSMIRKVADRIVDQKEATMFDCFMKVFSDKQMSMDYVDLEDQDIQKQKQKAKENLFMFGNGLGQLVWDTADIIRVIVGIIASIAMTISMFAAKTGNAVMDSPLWIFAILGVVVAFGFLYSHFTAKDNEVFEKWTEGTVWFNRAFMLYGHELYDNTKRAKDVRIYRQDKIADREMEKLNEHNMKDNGLIAKMGYYKAVMYLAKGVGNALCYLFVVAKAALGAFGVGSIVQYVGAFTQLVQHTGMLTWAYAENKVYTEHLEKLFDYLDIPNKKYQGTIPIEKGFFCNGGENDYEIEFRNVSFKYPGSDRLVLENVSTRLHIGKKLALVGENGAGKTTFIKLLCRLYDPTEGEILLNGINIKKYDYDEYMRIFSCVFQDFKLFAFSLGQNIAAARDYSKERAEECLKKVSFGDRYDRMTEGLETKLYKDVDEKGVDVSGGEEQKIALARALYKGTPVIVLDEPTAALDPIAEAAVYEDFGNMVENKTAIYISHRLSSCKFCDEITVFDKGHIVQQGTHESLTADKSGKYFELWNAQAKYYQKA